MGMHALGEIFFYIIRCFIMILGIV